MNFKSILLLSSCLLMWSGRLFSQELYCGTDQMKQMLQQRNPSVSHAEDHTNLTIYNSILSGERNNFKFNGSVYTIPVVFHIMHDNGPENIADSIVQQGINELNLRFQNSFPYFDSTGHQVNIQFCLASVDPQGNPTSGITRHQTALTNFLLTTDNDIDLKNIARWSPDLYYNVYVVANITGFIDGYSTFPYNAGSPADGVVIEYIYVKNSFLLTHETGHYCGLYHTFQNGCYNMNCLLNGDNVCDTPPDNTSQTFNCQGNSCTTDMDDTSGFNPFIADMNELPNYMDYTTCPLSFSQGQSERMELSVSQLRPDLSISNGCGGNPGVAPPLAGFNYTVSPCNNGDVSFSDSSSVNSITTEWDFNNDGLFEFIGHSFTYTFPASGTYLVTQRVNGIGGQDTISQTIEIHKGLSPNFPIEFGTTTLTDTLRLCEGDNLLMQGFAGGTSYLWSTGDTTQFITVVADTSFELNLTMVDSSGFSWSTACTPVYVKVSPFQVPVITYIDTIGYYCEGTPVNLNVVNPLSSGHYYWLQYTFPNGWENTGVDDTLFTAYPGPTYSSFCQVVYANDDSTCSASSNVILLQSQYYPFASGYSLDVNGNTMSYSNPNYLFQWYYNGLPIAGATTNSYTATQTGCYQLGASLTPYVLCETLSDTVCFAFTGINEFANDKFEVSPNPAKDVLQILFNGNDAINATVKLINLQGQVIEAEQKNSALLKKKLLINVSQVANGIYFLEVSQNASKWYSKVVISH